MNEFNVSRIPYMGLLDEFLLGDLAHAVQVGAIAAGHQRHRSMTNLRARERERKKKNIELKFAYETKCLPKFHLSFSLK